MSTRDGLMIGENWSNRIPLPLRKIVQMPASISFSSTLTTVTKGPELTYWLGSAKFDLEVSWEGTIISLPIIPNGASSEPLTNLHGTIH